MQVISQKTYAVMDGEPHLGKQIETVVEVDREEYIEALVVALSSGLDSVDDTFTVSDGDYEEEYTLGTDLSQEEIDNIIREMNMQLIDDDYGSSKEFDLIYEMLDDYISDDWTDKIEIIQMRGY